MMNILLDLPSELCVEVLCRWLDLKTLVQLDSANCNHEIRSALLRLYASSHCVVASLVEFDGKEIANWFLSRKLQISSLAISKYSPELVKYSRSHFSSIRHVACLIPDAVKVVGMCFRNLVSLTYRSSLVAPELSDMLWWNVNLQEFRLENVHQIDAEHFDALCLPHLRVLSLKGTICGDEKVNAIIATTRVLQKIEIGDSIKVTDNGMISVAQVCPQLQSFGLRALSISDGALLQLAQLCSCLTSLDLSYNRAITDLGVRAIAENLPKLRQISICYCNNLTDASIDHLTQYRASTLEVLHATGLPTVRVDVCIALLQKCTHLHSLSLDCDLNPHCAEVVPHMGNLHKLVVYSLLSDKALSLIAQHCKKLRKLGIYPYCRYQDDAINLEERGMHCANIFARWNDRLYTATGLLALMEGLSLLRVLGVDEKELKEGELTTFAQCVWQRQRPQLVFEEDSEQLAFDVLLG